MPIGFFMSAGLLQFIKLVMICGTDLF